MIPLVTLRELFAYNYWARDRQLEACAALSQEQFQCPTGSSFPSLRDTLAHLVGGEWVWLERCHGRSPRSLPAPEEFPTLTPIAERWRAIEKHDFLEYLAGLHEEALIQPLPYTGLTGETWTYPLWRALLHVVNHQTYHRGQVTTILKQLGVPPPPADLLIAHDMGLFDAVAQR
jgi:uncharacterized damage-inducible protein DinB